MTLQQLEKGRANNFDLIRFIAASLVIFSHSYWLTGHEAIEPLVKLCGMLSFGSLGVSIFFSISGFLITKSMLNQSSLQSFVWARILRIFPGLIAASFFCAFIIGLMATHLPVTAYLKHGSVYDFLWRQGTLQTYPNKLPGVFVNNPIPDNINSSIWTLPAELLMYLIVLVGGIILLRSQRKAKIYPTLLLLLVVLAYFYGVAYSADYMLKVAGWFVSFAGGGLCYIFRSKLQLRLSVFTGMMMVFLILFHFRFKHITFAFDVVLLYGVLVFAYKPIFQFKGFHKIGDLSYGLYIYALPVQQLVVQKTHLLSPLQHFLISYLIVLPIAAVSWFLIEKPMLKLKNIKLLTRSLPLLKT